MNKPGDIIIVFSDPVNLKLPEGQATLLTKEKEVGILESWFVHFTGEDDYFIYKRWIKKQNEPAQIIN